MSQVTTSTETPISALVPSEPIHPVVPLPIPHPVRFSGLDAALVLTMTLWAGNIVISKAATNAVPPIAYNGLRFIIAAFTMGSILRWRKVTLRLPRSLWLTVMLSGLFNFTLYQLTFIVGLHQTTAGNNALIIAIGPVWVVLISALRNQERITRAALFGIFLALFGVAVVVIGRDSGSIGFGGANLVGDLLSLLASVFWGIGVVISRIALTRDPRVPNITITFWALLVGAVTQLVVSAGMISQLPMSTFTPSIVGVLIYSGALSVALGTLIFNYGIEKRGATRTAIFSYLQPLIAAGLAIVFLDESLTLWLVFGSLLIFAGMILVRRT